MGIRNIIEKGSNIVEGHFNELIGNNKALAGPRRAICRKCPLYKIHEFWGWAMCDSHSYLNPKTGEKSDKPRPGFIEGCGCRIEAKITVPDEKCPAGKW